MSFSDIYSKHGIPFIVGFIIAFAVEQLLINALFFANAKGVVWLIALVTWTAVYLAMNFKKSFLRSLYVIVPLFLAFLTGIVQRFIPVLPMLKWNYLLGIIKWSVRYSSGTVKYIPKGADFYYCFIVFTLLSAFICFIVTKKKSVFYLIIPGILFIVEWMRYIDDLKLFNLYIIGLIVYSFYRKFFLVNKAAEEKGEVVRFYNYDTIMMYGVILSLTVVLIANITLVFFPIKVINERIGNKVPNFAGLRSEYPQARSAGNIFTFDGTMYQPNEFLGGSLKNLNRDVVMEVESDEPLVRLRGRVKTKYTGNQWVNKNVTYRSGSSESPSYELFEDMDETLEEDYYKVTIHATNISTTSIFSPYKYVTSDVSKGQVFGNADGVRFFNRTILQANPKTYTVIARKEDDVVELKANSEDMEMYLELPKNYSPTVTQITNDIIEGIDDPYERIRAIEKYLRSNYTYNLFVSDVSEYEDFVEHFLTEDKKGYCVYFASALGVMGRVAGVPTRYVEGYVLPDKTGPEGTYKVRGDRAHAWTEAYVEGKGWITLEATPAYPTDAEEDVEVSVAESESDAKERKDLAALREERLRDLDFEDEIAGGTSGKKTFRERLTWRFVTFALIGLFVVLYGLWSLIMQKKREQRWHNMNESQRSVVMIKRMISMLKVNRIENADKILPTVFIKKISKEYLRFSVSDDIIEIINRTLYSKSEIESHDFLTLQNTYIEIEDKVRQQRGKIKFFFLKSSVSKQF